MHISIFHPLLNVMLRSIGLPGTYGRGASAWEALVDENPAARRAMGLALIASAEWVDKFCRGVLGYDPIAEDVRREVIRTLF